METNWNYITEGEINNLPPKNTKVIVKYERNNNRLGPLDDNIRFAYIDPDLGWIVEGIMGAKVLAWTEIPK